MRNHRDEKIMTYYRGCWGFGWMPWVIFWTIFGLAFGFLSYNSSSSVYVFNVIPGILGVFFFIFVLFFVFRVFFGGFRHFHRHYWYNYGDVSEEILRRRYARGEINYKQFRKMLSDLKKER